MTGDRGSGREHRALRSALHGKAPRTAEGRSITVQVQYRTTVARSATPSAVRTSIT